ncbi:hypothetical protein [Myroides guanonis]|uniref:Uncharacterized protein n=1 Tax=Myroides guanonis TaxID=1150112 RepID=A0A1I3RX64_9FLAO|nr:hypothetical protein [Myroides guanonis]SFJ49979.1 hypothetical protein SAMN04487893_10917 [Myroides guanonis]
MENTKEYTITHPQGEVEKVVSVQKWIITLLIMMIPLVNIICLIIWAFSNTENKNRSNWAKAQLVMFLISIVLAIFFFMIFGITMLGLSES